MKWLSVIMVMLICMGYIVLAIEIKNINPRHYLSVVGTVVVSLFVISRLARKNMGIRKRNRRQLA